MRDYIFVFVLSFFWVLICGSLLQFFIIPSLPWGTQIGLIEGGDWLRFHSLALDLANDLRLSGWGAWQWRIENQAPASVAGLAYFITGIELPYVLLPLHAMLFASTAVSGYAIARLAGLAAHPASICVIPFFLFPSGAMVWGQIHNDIYSICGIFMVSYFWVRSFAGLSGCKSFSPSAIVWGLLILCFGMVLIVYVRPYLGEIVFLASLSCLSLVVIALLVAYFVKYGDGDQYLTKAKGGLFVVWGCVLGLFLQFFIVDLESQLSPGFQHSADEQVLQSSLGSGAPEAHTGSWQASSFLPTYVDRRLQSFFEVRDEFVNESEGSGSAIDLDVRFSSALDVAVYIPRATQIALFAPFPDQWFGEGYKPGGTLMRAVAAMEMTFLYLMFVGILLSMRSCHFSLAIWGLLLFSTILALVYALVVANVGTLYRMRYPSMLMWILIGMIGWFSWWRSRRYERK